MCIENELVKALSDILYISFSVQFNKMLSAE